jgi:plasmid stabilization system protein ParE
MEIVWTHKAGASFYKNLDYLQHNWNIDVANDFEFETFRTIAIIEKNPLIGMYDTDFGCNKMLVVKQIYLLYKIIDNTIVLLIFWDNRQKPIQKLDL